MKYLLLASLILAIPAQARETTASWYGDELRSRPMANGKPFVPEHLTCASWDYPLGTTIEIEAGTRKVFAVVTDRGPAKRLVAKGRTLDLSLGTWTALGLDPDAGLALVKIISVKSP